MTKQDAEENVVPRFGPARMLLGLAAYIAWLAIYYPSIWLRRRWATDSRLGLALLPWVGVWGYRDRTVPWWRQ